MEAHKKTLRLPKQREMLAKNIIIATLKSILPINFQLFVTSDEMYGLTEESIWNKLRNRYFSYTEAEFGYPPMHFFGEYVNSAGVGDYMFMTGLGITDRSWFIEKACKTGVLDPSHINDILIVVAENLEVVPLEKRFMERIADTVLCPSLKREKLRFFDIVWYENICKRENMTLSNNWDHGYSNIKNNYNEVLFYESIKKYERRYSTM